MARFPIAAPTWIVRHAALAGGVALSLTVGVISVSAAALIAGGSPVALVESLSDGTTTDVSGGTTDPSAGTDVSGGTTDPGATDTGASDPSAGTDVSGGTTDPSAGTDVSGGTTDVSAGTDVSGGTDASAGSAGAEAAPLVPGWQGRGPEQRSAQANAAVMKQAAASIAKSAAKKAAKLAAKSGATTSGDADDSSDASGGTTAGGTAPGAAPTLAPARGSAGGRGPERVAGASTAAPAHGRR